MGGAGSVLAALRDEAQSIAATGGAFPRAHDAHGEAIIVNLPPLHDCKALDRGRPRITLVGLP